MELGFSKSHTGEFLSLCRTFKKRPAAVVPVRVNMEMSPTQLARYEKLWDQIRKQQNAASNKVEAMLEIMESYIAENNHTPKRSARADI